MGLASYAVWVGWLERDGERVSHRLGRPSGGYSKIKKFRTDLILKNANRKSIEEPRA